MREINTNTSYGGRMLANNAGVKHEVVEYYSIQELSSMLRMAEGTIRNRLWRGDPMPPSVRIGRKRLFPSDQFHQWMIDMRV